MKHCIYLFLFIALISSFSYINAQTNSKKPLDHSVYANWKDLREPQISNNGKWVSYEINPARGNGWLYLVETEKIKIDSIFRGKSAVFSANSNYWAFHIVQDFDSLRALKIAKKKPEELPKDTVAILSLNDHKIKKFPNLKSLKVPEKNSDWLVLHFDKKEVKGKDSSKVKKEGTELLILNPITQSEHRFQNVAEVSISKNGSLVSFTSQIKDSLDTCSVFVFDTQKEKLERIFYRTGFVKIPVVDEKGEQVSFLFSIDTGSVKSFNLFYWNNKTPQVFCLVDSLNPALPKEYTISQNFIPWFSENGQKLYIGLAPKPIKEAKDTLLPEEKATFDLWSWTDQFLQPQQLKELETEKKRSYTAVYHIEKKQMIPLADTNMESISIINKGNADIALGSSIKPYRKFESWDQGYRDFYAVDLKTGKRKLLLEKDGSAVRISAQGNHLVWFEQKDSSWNSMNLSKGTKINLTKKIPVLFYNKLHDLPSDVPPVGIAGFTKDDKDVLIYDNYDIWVVDLSRNNSTYCLTNESGKKNKIQFKYVKLEKDEEFIDFDKPLMFKGFDETTKNESYWSLTPGKTHNLTQLVHDNYRFSLPIKAKNSNKLIWQKGNFISYPDLWISGPDFSNPVKVSSTNPQQKNYLWGTAESVKWNTANGQEMNGLLYKPENFDAAKKYPMIVYFYERNSDQLNAHYIPSPSRSSINFPYFVSNGYLVFIPDISYTVGYPGQSACDAVVSGTLSLIEKGFVESEHIGIQGQSWGGYQVAYMITHTNLFAAAGAGAPVSNMTSAYGGIRWESGVSRMFQYEKSQSRIGGTLWDKPLQYIENSPIFYVPKIQTPLLITHNDQDGAVPWYQGIELFVAMRRLGKQVWMINYNNDNHNLKTEDWGNRIDLSIRLGQFFDHFLKDTPAPKWMKDGIPAIKKGIEFGYE